MGALEFERRHALPLLRAGPVINKNKVIKNILDENTINLCMFITLRYVYVIP